MRRHLALGVVLGLAALAGAAAPPGVEAGGGTGTLQVVFPEAVEGVDPPQAGTDATRTLAANLFERLYDYHYLARPFRLEPSLAAALPEVSEDGRTWTVRLRPDVRYVDDPCFEGGKGRTVRASDVAFCLRRLVDAHVDSSARWVFMDRIEGLRAFAEASAKAVKDPHRAAYETSEGYPPVPGLAVVDDLTLRLRTPRRDPDLAHLLASTFASVYPPEAVKRYGDQVGRHPVGTGAYRVQTFLPGRSLVLVENPGYRKRTYPEDGTGDDERAGRLADAGRELPLNDRVVVTFQTDATVAWNAFVQGRSDMSVVPPALAPSVLDAERRALVPELAERGLGLAVEPRLEVFFLAFNMEDAVFGHPAGERGLAIRRALCLADDVEWEMQSLYRGTVVPVPGPLLDEFEESDPTFIAPWARRHDETLDEAKEAAREELAEAGLADGEGVPPLEMDVLDYAATRQAFQRFQTQVRDVGLTLEPRYVDWPTMRRRIHAGEARMWWLSWEADYPSVRTFLEVFYAPAAPDPIAGRYSNPEFDELYELALTMEDPDERTETYRELQELICQECPWRFRYRRLRYDAFHGWLKNYRVNGLVPRWFEYCRVDMARRSAYRR